MSLLLLSISYAGILDSVSDGVVIGNAPPSLDRAHVESRYPLMIENGLILSFPETNTCQTLVAPLSVDVLASNMAVGTVYNAIGSMYWGPTNAVTATVTPVGLGGQLAAGTKYSCVAAHFEGVNDYLTPTTRSITQWGSLSTGRNILGLIYTDNSLDATDALCGNGGDIHASVRSSTAGLELSGTAYDAVQLESSKKIWIQAATSSSTDTLRMIVSCK